MIRLMASAVLLTGCGYCGVLFASAFKKRCEHLEIFGKVLEQLEFDIVFLNIPLIESMEKLSRSQDKVFRAFFEFIAREMRASRCRDMQVLWQRAFERFRGELFLKDEDIRILSEFSQNLGSGDRTSEKNNIRAAAMRLKTAEEEAREFAKVNMKTYRGLGLLSGVFLVILLV